MSQLSNGSESVVNQLPTTDNKVLDELLRIMVGRFEVLVERGFLAPHFLSKMVQNPEEVLKFIRQNRSVVADTLNKRLNKKQRPSPEQLERMGIVPAGYFNYGYDIATKAKHRRKSSAGADLEMMLKSRPAKEDIIKKGVVNRNEMEYGNYYELDDTKLDDHIMHDENDYYSDDDNNKTFDSHMNLKNVSNDNIPWEISILSSLLFKTISEALKKSCLDTQQQESIILQEMIEMNNEMKSLRDTLDKYFLSDDISATVLDEKNENDVRAKFHSIQEKLMHISSRQNRIHEKLRILHSVERSMIQLQNNYQIRLSALKKTETQILKDLQQQKQKRDRAIKIMYAEKSHKSWAMTKLDYTINIATDYNKKRQELDGNGNVNELNDDIEFVCELEKFLTSLRNISEHQKQIVREFDQIIDDLESNLLSIRYDMSKVRTMTFKKIYDLHKQVQIAESLELGYRRLSVASATEIERERRHHKIKIQRQLNTLDKQIMSLKNVHYVMYEKNLREIIDVEIIMSNSKLKSFFSVWLQCIAQVVVDIELTYNNLNSELPPVDGGKVSGLCGSLYGVDGVLNKIKGNNDMSLNDKLVVCVEFLKRIKRGIRYERNMYIDMEKQMIIDGDIDEKGNNKLNEVNKEKMKKIKTFKVNNVMLIVGRKLCVNCVNEIEKIELSQIAKYAEMKCRDVFVYVLNGNKIFKKDPKTQMDAAKEILKCVYGINVKELVI